MSSSFDVIINNSFPGFCLHGREPKVPDFKSELLANNKSDSEIFFRLARHSSDFLEKSFLIQQLADDAYSIRSTWSCYWLDQFLTLALNILILSIFYISMDLSTNYFAHFSGC